MRKRIKRGNTSVFRGETIDQSNRKSSAIGRWNKKAANLWVYRDTFLRFLADIDH